MKTYCLYEHLFPNGKRYIGITSTTPDIRWRDGKGYKNQPKIARAIKKYGWENIQHNVIAENLTRQQAAALEKYLIASLNTISDGYNTAIGGENITTRYLNKLVLAMLRYARHNDITTIVKYSDGEQNIVELVDGDRNDPVASEMWNDASEAVNKNHGPFSPHDFDNVARFWWHMSQYYVLWLLTQMGKDTSNWAEEPYEKRMAGCLNDLHTEAAGTNGAMAHE